MKDLRTDQNHLSVERDHGHQHHLTMNNRAALDIAGVKQVESFDNEEFLLETTMGYLAISGQNLHMKNLDVNQGVVSIQGKIDDIRYLDDHTSTEKSKGFLTKLFK